MKLSGTCPYCGAEMQLGYLQCGQPIMWSQEEKLAFVIRSENEYVVSHGLLEGCYAETYFCKNCDIFILEKREQPKKTREKLKKIFGKQDE